MVFRTIHLLVALLYYYCCTCTSCRAFISTSRLDSDQFRSVAAVATGSDLRVAAVVSNAALNTRMIKRSRWRSAQQRYTAATPAAAASLRRRMMIVDNDYSAVILETITTTPTLGSGGNMMHLFTVASAAAAATTTSPEPIHTAFTIATFLPQPFWLLLILFPNASITKHIMGGVEVILLCSLVHLFIVVASIVTGGTDATAPLSIFADVFDMGGDPQAAFLQFQNYPNFIAEEWSHVLTWDLLVGRYIWLDGLKRQIPTQLSLLVCNLIGPPGLLIHFATCIFQGKPVCDKLTD